MSDPEGFGLEVKTRPERAPYEGQKRCFQRRRLGVFFSRSVDCGDNSFNRHKLDKKGMSNPEGFGLEVKTRQARPPGKSEWVPNAVSNYAPKTPIHKCI